MGQEQNERNAVLFDGDAAHVDKLPYAIELRDQTDLHRVERVLARAQNMVLAMAIFQAAQTEHTGRTITLRRGTQVIAAFPPGMSSWRGAQPGSKAHDAVEPFLGWGVEYGKCV